MLTDGYYPNEIMRVEEDQIEGGFFIKESISQNNEEANISKRPLVNTSKKHKFYKSSVLTN